MTDHVYRVVPYADWLKAQEQGRVPKCGSDMRSGFIHLSTAENVIETANLYFEIDEVPVALEIRTEALGEALRWEPVPSRDNQTFPHLYNEGVPVEAVLAWHELVKVEGNNSFTLGTKHLAHHDT